MAHRTRRKSLGAPYLWLVCVAFCVPGWGQSKTATATVSFALDFPGADPAHYGISVASDGHASYVSDGKVAKDAESDQPYSLEFTVSQPYVDHIFELARQAHYFEGNIDSKKKSIASTGDKILTYRDVQKNTVANYNYSPVPAVQELTSLFQNLSTTLEFGRRLEYDYHYQKLALDEESKAMEDAAARGGLVELAAIAPTLRKIADDPSVINVVRARIEQLLEHAGTAPR